MIIIGWQAIAFLLSDSSTYLHNLAQNQLVRRKASFMTGRTIANKEFIFHYTQMNIPAFFTIVRPNPQGPKGQLISKANCQA